MTEYFKNVISGSVLNSLFTMFLFLIHFLDTRSKIGHAGNRKTKIITASCMLCYAATLMNNR